jgi:hypothetical protein
MCTEQALDAAANATPRHALKLKYLSFRKRLFEYCGIRAQVGPNAAIAAASFAVQDNAMPPIEPDMLLLLLLLLLLFARRI